ncbi:MAG: TldD/PmbA family protein [Candidatus Thorarchaeota archaeon]|nr:MAG: hypothetical protein DRP09_03240 [Candidatus Thorarchaeota archaeon]
MLDSMTRAIEYIPHDVAFADFRGEVRTGTQLYAVNGSLRQFKETYRAGVVARALVGTSWGMASSSEQLDDEGCKRLLSEAVKMARASAKHSEAGIDLSSITPNEGSVWQKMKIPPSDVPVEEKIDFVMDINKAMKIDDRIVNTNSIYGDNKSVFSLVNSLGSRLEWDEHRIRAVAQPVARDGSGVQFDYAIRDGLAGYELVKSIDTEAFGRECAQGALDLLTAEKPPSGKMTVVIDSTIAGLIAHEVCGHASEADEVVKERSFLTGMVGKKIGTDLVTMIDDATLEGCMGSYPFDSEGTPSSRTPIIEGGVFTGYMHTLETAALMGVDPTGNGRAQDYNRRIYARMSNTFFDKGTWKDDEIISDTKRGLYVVRSTSGMEDVVGGGVQASALKGYLIENGEKTTLVRSMTLAGKVLDILKTVDAVGDTLSFDGGMCGKGEEDFVPVSTGGPHMRAELMVGGG